MITAFINEYNVMELVCIIYIKIYLKTLLLSNYKDNYITLLLTSKSPVKS